MLLYCKSHRLALTKPSVKSDSQTIITGSHIISPRPARDVSMLLPHRLVLILNRRLIRPTHPVTHRHSQSLGAVRLILNRSSRGIGQDILAEPTASTAPVRRIDRRRAIAALLEADVAVGGTVVAGADLELDPGGWQLGSALHTSFETCWKAHEGACTGIHGC